jgi:hypothetical protein
VEKLNRRHQVMFDSDSSSENENVSPNPQTTSNTLSTETETTHNDTSNNQTHPFLSQSTTDEHFNYGIRIPDPPNHIPPNPRIIRNEPESPEHSSTPPPSSDTDNETRYNPPQPINLPQAAPRHSTRTRHPPNRFGYDDMTGPKTHGLCTTLNTPNQLTASEIQKDASLRNIAKILNFMASGN